MKTIKRDHHITKMMSALSRIAAGRTNGHPLPAEAAMALARSTLVAIGERVPSIHVSKREIYFRVERKDDETTVLVQMDEERAA